MDDHPIVSREELRLLERIFRCGRVELGSFKEQWRAAKELEAKGWARLPGPPYNSIEITAVGADKAYARALSEAGFRYRRAVAFAHRKQHSEEVGEDARKDEETGPVARRS